MKVSKLIPAVMLILFISINVVKAQDDTGKLILSGELLTDQRFLLKNDND
ncbi:MAG: hypothetical protein L3J56_05925 [Bacteroidales bacterium]|nr:hypothetical protein [Bacteroidales bacterium]